VDVYLKAKDPIEKAKRVQKKSAAAPGSHRPGGSDRATVGGPPDWGTTPWETPDWGEATSPRPKQCPHPNQCVRPNQCMCHKVRKDSPWGE